MSTHYPVLSPEEREDRPEPKRRSAWRIRLIEAERGFSFGFRNGSTLFGHIFFCLIIVVTAMTLGVRFWQWTGLIVAMACGLAAELFYLAVRVIADSIDDETTQKAVKLSAAGMVMMMLGAGAVILYILGSRLMEILA